jgi:hypothetical protein
MDYKGIEYHVAQTDDPAGWRWTVHMEGREPRTGSGHNRTAAVALAQIAIDKLLKAQPADGGVVADASVTRTAASPGPRPNR